jgi:catechol 2,3-dioxygenase
MLKEHTLLEAMAMIDPNLRIGSVHLDVSDLPRSVDFYERVMGIPVVSHEPHQAQLGPDREHPALVLSDIAAPTPLPAGATGLFHVAWLHPSRAALADSVRRVVRARWPFEGASDHGVSEALYLSDPDGLGIEIYADRPRERWEHSSDGRWVNMVTLPLDLDDLLAQSLEEPGATVAAQTAVGHVHLKVSDVPRAAAFYRDALGLQEQAQLPSAAFLAAGGYHHHVGLNSWQSRGAPPAPQSAPGLRSVEFVLSDSDALDALERDLHEALASSETLASFDPEPVRVDDGRLSLRDPDGQLLSFGG